VIALVVGETASAGDAEDLRRAILQDDLPALSRLVESRTPLNTFTRDDESALMIAARRGSEQMVDLLLKHGADPKATNRFRKTPLMSACESHNTGVVVSLLRAGADPNSKGANGETAYLYAARYSSPDVLVALEKAGADINATDALNRGPLRWAAFQSNERVVRYLLGKDVNVNQAGIDGVSPLLAAKTDPVRRLLVEAGADVRAVDGEGNTVLTNGLTTGLSVDLAKFLLKKGANVNARKGADSGQTPLMYASWYGGGNGDMVRLLLANGANVNHVDRYGRTALMQVSSKEIASILIDAGADLKHRNYEGRTALEEAIWRHNRGVVELLRQSGVPE